jgi:hypothetical protein
MTKTVSLVYSNINIPTSVIPNSVRIDLVDPVTGAAFPVASVPFGTLSVDIPVSAGTWKVRIHNFASGGADISEPVESGTFEVIETVTVSVVTGVSV